MARVEATGAAAVVLPFHGDEWPQVDQGQNMPLKPSEEYRERAKRARALAARTQSERSKESFLRVAADCDRLAELAAKVEQAAELD